jgi:hypothetical protein
MFSKDVDFVQQLARMIYCAGSIDGEFSNTEKRESVAIIQELSKEEFGIFSDGLMINEIRDLVENEDDPNEILQEFKSYYQANEDKFPEEVKKAILEMLDRVLYSQNKRNKSELVFLSQLELLFFGRLF